MRCPKHLLSRLLSAYASCIIKHSCSIFIISLIFLAASVILILSSSNGLKIIHNPSAIAGFEPRGTPICNRLRTLRNLDNAIRNKKYSTIPIKFLNTMTAEGNDLFFNKNSNSSHGGGSFSRVRREVEEEIWADTHHFFCSHPGTENAKIIYMINEKVTGRKDLLTLRAIKSMCHLQMKTVEMHVDYKSLCSPRGQNYCCPTWSLPNYVTLLSRKDSCDKLNESNIAKVRKLLLTCAPYYFNQSLGPDCWSPAQKVSSCSRSVPSMCYKYNAIYDILHYIVDIGVYDEVNNRLNPVKYSIAFVSLAKGKSLIRLYNDNFNADPPTDMITEVAAVDFDVKRHLFDEYIMNNVKYPLSACAVIFILLFVFIKSITIVLVTAITACSSLVLSYWIYGLVTGFDFFPLINLAVIAVVLIFAVNWTIIFYSIKRSIKQELISQKYITLSILISLLIEYGLPELIAISVIISAIFFVNIVSPITIVKCFGIFAGIAVLVHSIISAILIPVIIVIYEKYFLSCCRQELTKTHVLGDGVLLALIYFYFYSQKKLCDVISHFLETTFASILVRLRIIFIAAFTIAFLISTLIIFSKVTLRRPNTKNFRVFSNNHLFERYEFKYQHLFHFEKTVSVTEHIPVKLVWGFLPKDNGNYFNPYDNGTLVKDGHFEMYSKSSQKWLYNLCREFNKLNLVLTNKNCFMLKFTQWMSKPCPSLSSKRHRCCNATLPYSQQLFSYCLKFQVFIEKDLREATPLGTGIKWDNNDEPSALIIDFVSKTKYSPLFKDLQRFHLTFESTFKRFLKSAPNGLRRGFYISSLEFYSLQDSVSSGLIHAILLGLVFLIITLILSSYSIILSLLTLLCIVGTICTSMAIFIQLGWYLNMLETIAIPIACSLSVYFPFHYMIALTFAPEDQVCWRFEKISYVLGRTGKAVTMSTIICFSAGLLLTPATILAYIRIGTILIVVQVLSWLYTNLFLLPLACMVSNSNKSKICYQKFTRICFTSSSRNMSNEANNADYLYQQVVLQPVLENGVLPHDTSNYFPSLVNGAQDNPISSPKRSCLTGSSHGIPFHLLVDSEKTQFIPHSNDIGPHRTFSHGTLVSNNHHEEVNLVAYQSKYQWHSADYLDNTQLYQLKYNFTSSPPVSSPDEASPTAMLETKNRHDAKNNNCIIPNNSIHARDVWIPRQTTL